MTENTTMTVKRGRKTPAQRIEDLDNVIRRMELKINKVREKRVALAQKYANEAKALAGAAGKVLESEAK